MSKSLIYAGNSATQATTAAGTNISFTNIVRRYGCNLNISGGNVVADGAGYYNGTVNLTIAGTEAGTATVEVLSNGTAIPYAETAIVTTATSQTNVVIPFITRNQCNCLANTLTVNVSGAVTNVVNAAIAVEKE